MEKWEVSLDRTWSVVRDQWVAKWKMVTHASDMAAKRGGYESAAALRAGATANPEAPASSVTIVSRADYDAVVEYSAALEAENLELRSVEIIGASTISSLPDTVATTSSTTTAVITEMKRAQEMQAKAHAAKIAQLTALITAAAAVKAPSPVPAPGGGVCVFMNPSGTRCVRHPPPKGVITTGTDRIGRAVRTCSSCTKNWVTHAADAWWVGGRYDVDGVALGF